MHVKLSINGEPYEADVEPRLLLVHMLRDVLRLTGTHIGCDTSHCGACTILMDGRPVKSCTIFAVQAQGKQLMTVEGLEQDGVAGCHFAVWAPNARYVAVMTQLNGWSRGANVLRKHDTTGIWSGFIPGVPQAKEQTRPGAQRIGHDTAPIQGCTAAAPKRITGRGIFRN